MFSLQRKLSGCCWHPAQHFLDGDLLVGYKMSPGHMTCLCFAHSHCLLKIFKWRRERPALCPGQSSRNYRPPASCSRRDVCTPRGLVRWHGPLVGADGKAPAILVYPIDVLFRKPRQQRQAITDHSWPCCSTRNRGYNVNNLKRPPPATHRVGQAGLWFRKGDRLLKSAGHLCVSPATCRCNPGRCTAVSLNLPSSLTLICKFLFFFPSWALLLEEDSRIYA